MRWPWQKPEKRQSGGGYTDTIVAALEAQASATVADVSSTAAIEAAAGALSRAFMAAEVDGPSWVQESINPVWLGQVGRSLIREGASLSVIVMDPSGSVEMIPAAFWNFENVNPGAQEGERESTWQARVTTYGPSSSFTRLLGRERLVYVRWGTSPGARYRGRGPTSWAHLTARLQGEVERSLADEVGGPLAQLLSVPADGGTSDEDDPLAMLKADIGKARGKALFVETTAAAWDQGKAAAPQKDWNQNRLGPMPPDSMVNVSKDVFTRMLAACGCSPALFDDSDGTSKREALRQFHLGTVLPLARMLEAELTAKLDVPVKLQFDLYNVDLQGRATSFQKLVAGGVPVNEALVTSGLLSAE